MIETLRFAESWRDYQARVLAEADAHLADGKVHVVAAPGSGKTTLGLELVRRIGRPALVLAPTLTIRNQWVDRLRRGFLDPAEDEPAWISYALDAPGSFTVSTYQALHAAWSADREGFAATLAGAAFTLVLDEAHHLRREWWRALQALIDATEPAVIALTATPPYDVPGDEWQRYEQACGPIDSEIAAPELVRNGDLCPHQDYLLLSVPTAAELPLVVGRRQELIRLFDGLIADRAFAATIAVHPWLADPEYYQAEILDAPELLSAMLIFLRAAGQELPPTPFKLLGASPSQLPRLTPRWMEILLEAVLFSHHEIFGLPSRAQLKADLERLGAIEGGRVRIIETEDQFRLMASSAAKLNSIVRVARAELASRGDRIRMVVLTEHVRASDLPHGDPGDGEPAKLGVGSIFGALHQAGVDSRLGVLSGSLVIVPNTALPALEEAARDAGTEYRATPLPHCPGHARIAFTGSDNHRAVEVITRLFGAGEINLLVGTQALLGEGWDAPSINVLVLASNTGSYMMSNQMRGRAIRINPAEPDKVANIWHLATIAPDQPGAVATLRGHIAWSGDLPPGDPIGRVLGPDMELLKRRFAAFPGVGYDRPPRIETGLGRLCLGHRQWDIASIEALDADMLTRAADRAAVATGWREAIGDAEHRSRRMRHMVRPTYAPRAFALGDTLQYLAISGLGGGLLSAAGAMRQFGAGYSFGTALGIFALATLVYGLPKMGWAAWLLLRNGTLESSLYQVSETVLDSLDHAGLLAKAHEDYAITVTRLANGEKRVSLENADRASERLFLDALAEVLGPVANPRYLLVRRSRILWRDRSDFHAVPAVLGQRKEIAEHFATEWRKRVGAARLVFARSEDGRRILLQARIRSLAAGFQRAIDRHSAWE